MRVSILICLLCFFLKTSIAQNCDIAQTGVAVYNAANTAPVAIINTGQNANFKFSIANFGTDPGCTIPANSVTAIFDFPTLAGGIKPYIYNGPLSFVSGYFSWTYLSADEVLLGTNTTAIPNGLGDANILVKVIGNASGAGSSNLNLAQGNGISDNTGNNYSGAQLTVVNNSPLPILLASFTAVPDKCDALLSWATRTEESNFSHFEIEYSPDARTFVKLGTVPGKAVTAGADYKFIYRQLNGNGYYRLKQVDKDGRFEYSKVIRTTTNCSDKGRVLVYPNPINYDQKLIVNISGYAGRIRAELFNADGKKVSDYNLVNGANELPVLKVSAGVYMLYVRGEEGQAESFKIVVIR
jgi:hypothetical protein